MNLKLLKDRLNEVIKTDATVVADSDFLATHIPFKELSYKNSGISDTELKSYSENEFFNEFFQENLNKHGFIVVQGDSGSGKSHFIRWLKYKYDNEIVNKQDVSILIERSKNTLKGTIDQILNNKIIKNALDEVELKKLLNAGGKLSEEKLIYTLAYQFVAEIDSEEDDDCILNGNQRGLLSNFLKDDLVIKEVLLSQQGPINRIKTRLVDDDISKEVSDSLFNEEDFNFSYDDHFILKLTDENGGNKKAVKCAEKLIENRRNFKGNIVNYLNTKIDSVIQSVISLNAQDMREIFYKIRKKLKEQDKTLTLFIEDITSFSGIDKALAEALVVEHTSNDEICKIFSVIGITKSYYRNQFPDNIKARITGRIGIEKESIFGDENTLIDLTAKYLNAITQEKKALDSWLEGGAIDRDIPISEMFYNYKWSLYKDSEGREFSLYPFNENAIINLYNQIEEKTPRTYIREVVKAMMELYVKNENEFPPSIDIVKYSLKTPRWKNSLIEQNLEKKFSQEECKRITTFMTIWGNGTIDRVKFGEKELIGSIELDLFKDFNIPIVNEVVTKSEVALKKEIAKKNIIVEDKRNEIKIDKSKEYNSLKKEDVINIVNSKKIDKIQNLFNESELEINNWYRENGILKDHIRFREYLIKFFENSIDWEYEGISKYCVNFKINKNRIFIEGQQGAINEKGFTLKRDKETYYLLLSVAAWGILGDKSWNFEGSYDYILNLNLWLAKNGKLIINYVKENNETEKNMFKASILAEYYYKSTNGLISGNENEEELLEILIDDSKLNDEVMKKTLGQLYLNVISEKENILANKDLLLRYFNCVLGNKISVISTTSVFYLDSYKILEYILELKKSNYRCSELKNIKLENKLNYGIVLCTNIWGNLLIKVVDEKIQNIESHKEDIIKIIGNDEDIEATVIEIKKFFEKVLDRENIVYNTEIVKFILEGQLTGESLKEILIYSDNIKNSTLSKKIYALSAESLENRLKILKEKFEQIYIEVNEINKDFINKVESNKGKKEELDSLKIDVKNELIELKKNILELDKEHAYVIE